MKKLDKLADATPGSMVRFSCGGRFLVCEPKNWGYMGAGNMVCLLVVNWKHGEFGELTFDNPDSASYSLLEEEDLE